MGWGNHHASWDKPLTPSKQRAFDEEQDKYQVARREKIHARGGRTTADDYVDPALLEAIEQLNAWTRIAEYWTAKHLHLPEQIVGTTTDMQLVKQMAKRDRLRATLEHWQDKVQRLVESQDIF